MSSVITSSVEPLSIREDGVDAISAFDTIGLHTAAAAPGEINGLRLLCRSNAASGRQPNLDLRYGKLIATQVDELNIQLHT